MIKYCGRAIAAILIPMFILYASAYPVSAGTDASTKALNPQICLAKVITDTGTELKNITDSPLVLDRKGTSYEPVKSKLQISIHNDVYISADRITFSNAEIVGDLFVNARNVILNNLKITGSIHISPEIVDFVTLNGVVSKNAESAQISKETNKTSVGGTNATGGISGSVSNNVKILTDVLKKAGIRIPSGLAAFGVLNEVGDLNTVGLNGLPSSGSTSDAVGGSNTVIEKNAADVNGPNSAADLSAVGTPAYIGDLNVIDVDGLSTSGSSSAADNTNSADIGGKITSGNLSTAESSTTVDIDGLPAEGSSSAADSSNSADIDGLTTSGNVSSGSKLNTAGDPNTEKQSKAYLELMSISSYDSSLLVVNKDRSLPAGWKPKDLTLLKVPYRGRQEAKYMRKEAADALVKLFEKAGKDKIRLCAISGFRSYELQKTVHSKYIAQLGAKNAALVSAPPGRSEHQTGLAVDISSASVNYNLVASFGKTKEGKWLLQNAAQFGFIIRYPEGKTGITGYAYEPWHIRYVGMEPAKEMSEKGITFEEYLGISPSSDSFRSAAISK